MQTITIAVVVYMGMALLSYAVLVFLSWYAEYRYRRGRVTRSIKTSALSRRSAPPVTIIAPAKNEEPIIFSSVKALLGNPYPNLSLVVVDDGSTDRTFDILHRSFALVESADVPAQTLDHKPILSVWRSLKEPRLTVVRKVASGGSKGCANNAGLEVVTAPYVFVTDIDSVVEADAIARMVVRMGETGAFAIGCPLRPLNGCTVHADGSMALTKRPRNYWAFCQVMEYVRAFQFRYGWARFGMLNNISGAAGLFRVEALKMIGGYRTDTTAEDLGSTFAFHLKGLPIAFEPGTNVYTQVPETWASLKSQRTRWARGLLDNLWYARRLLNPVHGRHAFIVAWLWVFEVIEPFVEVAGIAIIVVRVFDHTMPPEGWMLIVAGLLSTALLSVVCTIQNERCYRRLSLEDTAIFVLFSFVELVPLKIPLLLLWRISGTFDYLAGNTSWEALPRQAFEEDRATGAAAPPQSAVASATAQQRGDRMAVRHGRR